MSSASRDDPDDEAFVVAAAEAPRERPVTVFFA